MDYCQVGVFAGYVSENGYSLVDKRLYIPEQWFTEEYEERRKKCDLPDDIIFQTKPQLAADMLLKIHKEKILPFKYILADSIYGNNPEFISVAEALPDTTYLVSVPKNLQCWLKRPMEITRQYRRKGELKTKKVLVDGTEKPIRIDEVARNINDFFWYRRQVSEGTKGPIIYEFTRRQVILATEGLPTKPVWLLVRRTLDKKPEYSFFICNAPHGMRLKTLIWLSGLRWAIEQSFEETKTELGMDHYEVRKFKGWHHHMLTCILAHFFLWHLKIRMGKKSSIYYTVAA